MANFNYNRPDRPLKKDDYCPWGWIDNVDLPLKFSSQIGELIQFVSTPGHGGFYVSPESKKKMPEKIRAFNTFTQRHDGNLEGLWYEEDCDICAVVLAFPDLFSPRQVYACVRMVKNYGNDRNGTNYMQTLKDYLSGEEGEDCLSIADQFIVENGEKYESGSMGSSGKGWTTYYARIKDGDCLALNSKEYPPSLATREELEALGVTFRISFTDRSKL